MNTLFLLLLIFQLKHFICDFPLQNEYMLGKFKEKGWVLPLLSHGLVHAVATFIISLIFTHDLNKSIVLAVLDLIIHSTMDRIKASPKMLGKYKSMTKEQYVRSLEKIDNFKRQLSLVQTDSMNKLYLQAVSEHNELKRNNSRFWSFLGLDQLVHHVTHYFIIYLIIN